MISAILSLCLGILGFILPLPLILPVFGVALGLNAIIKEKKRELQRKRVKVMSMIGIILGSLAIIVYFLGMLLKK